MSPGLGWQVDYHLEPLGTDYLRLNVVIVPEPASVALMMLGLGLVGTMRRRRSQVKEA